MVFEASFTVSRNSTRIINWEDIKHVQVFPPTGNLTMGAVEARSTTKESKGDPFLVELDPEEDPKNLSKYRKWSIIFFVCTGALCSTCSTSMVRTI